MRKIGRTHLQDAVPLDFADEVSAWRYMLEENEAMLRDCLPYLAQLAIGGTAVGSGLNAPALSLIHIYAGDKPTHNLQKSLAPRKSEGDATECTGEIEMIEDILLILHIAFLCERS